MDGRTAAALIRCYYKCNDSISEAIRCYSYRENKLKHPICSEKVLRGIIKRFEDTGNANPINSGGRPSTIVDSESVVSAISESKATIACSNDWGTSSVREIARDTGFSKSSVHRILRQKLMCRPYKLKVMQELKDTDFEKRLQFAQDFLDHFLHDIEFVIWSDEAYFYLDGTVHTRNAYIWSSENHHSFVTKPLHPEKVCVWVAFSAKIMIPVVIIESGTIDGDVYLNILQNSLVPYLKQHRLCSKSIYQHDGAPPHIKKNVQQFLTKTFGEDRLISRFHTHLWPPRSPDLSPVDFWYWGMLKRLVYQPGLPPSKTELIKRIRNCASQISLSEVSQANNSFLDRLSYVTEEGGGHFEHLL